MTCREKLAMEHPECLSPEFDGGCMRCPHSYGYLSHPGAYFCSNISCRECWDREIPGTLPMQYPIDTAAEAELAKGEEAQWPKENPHISDPVREAAKKLADSALKTGEAIRNAAKAMTDNAPIILDSGNRTEFATGAVRDMREGKGRCDLMPLEVASRFLFCDAILEQLRIFQKTNDTGHLYSALVRFCGQLLCDHGTNGRSTLLLEVAKHFEEGAKKYGENNWQKGIPVHCYIDSAVRHYLKWLRGDKDEPHDRAFVWNLMCCIWEVDYREKEETVPVKRTTITNDGDGITLGSEIRLLPATKAPDKVRLGDCVAGLFEFDGRAYLKVHTLVAPKMYVDVIAGTVRQLDPDILVTPLEIWEVDGGEDE